MSRRTKSTSAVLVETEETRVEKFGQYLYDNFNRTVHSSISDLQLEHYCDYIHHFGFSIERECVQRNVSYLSTAITLQNSTTAAPLPYDTITLTDEVVTHAGWGIDDAERQGADAQARAVGTLEGLTKPEEVTARLVEPFQQVTWRQSITQCTMKKARALYCWLCENVTVELSFQNSVAGVETPIKKDYAQKSAVGTRNVKRKVGVEMQPDTNTVEVIDPLVLALQRRTADPCTLARLYQRCLQHAGVESIVVEGYIRGRAPEECMEWAWNIVCIPQEKQTVLQYLVDVALSSYTGSLRHVEGGIDTAAAEAERVKAAISVEPPSLKTKRSTVIQEEKKPKRSLLDGPALASSASQVKRIEDFYFNTHPQQFCATHFPNDRRCTLLVSPPRKITWEGAPCLTHNFFRFPLALVSHWHRCTFTARSTPFYVSFMNAKPERTELCCFLFKGELKALPEDCSTASPLGPQWVWHQREESNGCETFTVMVPEAGYYSVVVGAREIRKDPFSAVISEDSFVPVVAYQVLVTFVSHQVPCLPRQYFSPSVCKLLAPLAYQVREGTVRFVVMPSCANVAGVAVVSRRPSDESRELLSFLPFSFELVAYTGDVKLTGGHEAEVWILYAALDQNYMKSTELARMASCSTSHVNFTYSESDGSRVAGQQVTSPTEETQSGLLFLPFVTSIEVTRLATFAAAGQYIQPQTSMEGEQRPTLRRLIGVTPELYREATALVEKTLRPVGSYFESKHFSRK